MSYARATIVVDFELDESEDVEALEDEVQSGSIKAYEVLSWGKPEIRIQALT
jgi:hypothetical protein